MSRSRKTRIARQPGQHALQRFAPDWALFSRVYREVGWPSGGPRPGLEEQCLLEGALETASRELYLDLNAVLGRVLDGIPRGKAEAMSDFACRWGFDPPTSAFGLTYRIDILTTYLGDQFHRPCPVARHPRCYPDLPLQEFILATHARAALESIARLSGPAALEPIVGEAAWALFERFPVPICPPSHPYARPIRPRRSRP